MNGNSAEKERTNKKMEGNDNNKKLTKGQIARTHPMEELSFTTASQTVVQCIPTHLCV